MNPVNHLAAAFTLSTAAFMATQVLADEPPQVNDMSANEIAFPISSCGIRGDVPGYVANHLITVFDRSGSVDVGELRSMLNDAADAITDPHFISAVEQTGPVAFSTATFSSGSYGYRVLPTYIIEDEASALVASVALRESIASMEEDHHSGTDLGLAMRVGYGVAMACEDELNTYNDVFAHNVRINVISDFEDGANHVWTRDTILGARRVSHLPYVTISGFGLVEDEHDVAKTQDYIMGNVMGGPQSFCLTVTEGENFGSRFRQKIVMDLGFNDTDFPSGPVTSPG